MKYLLIAIAFSSYASASSTLCPLDSKGELELPYGYTITSKKTGKEADLLTLEPSKENPFGGSKQVWKLHKDSQGRIVKIESGLTQPSSQFVQFVVNKRKLEVEKSAMYESEDDGLVPSLNSFTKIATNSTMKPIKYGGVIEMSHDAGVCSIKKIEEKLYDPAQKISLGNPLYDESFCPQVKKAFSQVSRDIQECSEKNDRHKQIIAQIKNGPSDSMLSNTGLPQKDRLRANLTSGAGGGGGSPAIGRSIASISTSTESSFSMNNHLLTAEGHSLQLKEMNKLCESSENIKIQRTSINDNAPSAGSVRKN